MKKTIAVFFGGKSTEHDISIITALSSVIKPLELSKLYTVVPVYIAKDGAWYSDKSLSNISFYTNKSFTEALTKLKPVSVQFNGGLVLQKQSMKRERITIDIGFPAMHGSFGEDGSLMGLLRMAGIPFIGSDMEASVIAMDKVLAKQVAQANNIATSKFVFTTKAAFTDEPNQVVDSITGALSFPLFVKPAHLGSSIGITKVTDADSLRNALEVAAYYDEKIIVEEAVNNLIEVTVPIIGNETPEAALVERPLSKDTEFFDFDTKYMHGGGKKGGAKTAGAQGYSELPAQLPGDMYEESIQLAKTVYRATGCEGIARIDLLIDSESKKIYFNEINPLPGSLYAHNWRAAGVPGVELVQRLVHFAEARHAKQQKIQRTFSTNFLNQF